MYEKIFEKYSPEKENLIYILHEIQDNHPQQYVSEDAVTAVSEYLKIPRAHIYGVLTFYTMFSTKPRGKNVIRLCESPPCFLKGSEKVLRKLRDVLDVKVGETTPDGLFTLELCACLGSLAAGVKEIEAKLREELDKHNLSDEINILETGSFGYFGTGVSMMIYPEQTTYANIKEEDIAEIVEEHFLKGGDMKLGKKL